MSLGADTVFFLSFVGDCARIAGFSMKWLSRDIMTIPTDQLARNRQLTHRLARVEKSPAPSSFRITGKPEVSLAWRFRGKALIELAE